MTIADKKAQQLGMSPSTAAHRLRIDILFQLVVKAGYRCWCCGGALTRDTFSIEHKEAWLDSEDPIGLFFDLDNIAFSHHACNVGRARQPFKRHASVKAAKATWKKENPGRHLAHKQKWRAKRREAGLPVT